MVTSLVKQLAEELTYDQVQDTEKIKELLEGDLPTWDEDAWEDLRAAVAKTIREPFYLIIGTGTATPAARCV